MIKGAAPSRQRRRRLVRDLLVVRIRIRRDRRGRGLQLRTVARSLDRVRHALGYRGESSASGWLGSSSSAGVVGRMSRRTKTSTRLMRTPELRHSASDSPPRQRSRRLDRGRRCSTPAGLWRDADRFVRHNAAGVANGPTSRFTCYRGNVSYAVARSRALFAPRRQRGRAGGDT